MTARLANPSLEAACRVAKIAALYLNGSADRESLRAAVEDFDRLLLPPPQNASTSQASFAWGGGGGLPTNVEGRTRQPRRPRTRGSRPSEQSEEKRSWLAPYGDAWKEAYQGVPPWGQLAAALGELHKSQGLDEVLRRWRIYLGETDARYASPFRFAQTFGRWGSANLSFAKADAWNDQRPGEDLDAYIARLAKGR